MRSRALQVAGGRGLPILSAALLLVSWAITTDDVLAAEPASAPPAPPVTTSRSVVERHHIQPLPGSLDETPVLNSNSPEQVQGEGILVSTCAPTGKKFARAHLDYKFNGRFDIFAHHVAKGSAENLRTLYLGVVLTNPGKQKITVKILSGASYLSQPDAPFVPKKPIEPNDDNQVFAGPGDRVMSDVLRNQKAPWLPDKIQIPADSSVVLASLPIPVKDLTPPLNGRSLLIRLQSSGPVCAATLAMYAPACGLGSPSDAAVTAGSERAPSNQEWLTMLQDADLAGPREKAATPPGTAGPMIYGRVAGVSKGSVWASSTSKDAPVPLPDALEPLSFPIASLERGTFGTGVSQSAPLLVRYPESAYRANGNYAVHYKISLSLVNRFASARDVIVRLQSPVKNDTAKDSLTFLEPPPNRVFFRGTVLVSYVDDSGTKQNQFFHLVINQGGRGEPLIKLRMNPGDNRKIQVEFLYPPDATPPQVLTVEAANG